MTAQQLNRCFMRLEDRAERITPKQITETFVSVGPLLDLLSSNNNQIMYGRRGTGKTHALRYFCGQKNAEDDIAIYIDAQNIGSNGSIYNDTTIPISERATRLLVDICSAIHHELLEVFTDPDRGFDISQVASLLDGFVDSFNETRVIGSAEAEQTQKLNSSDKLASSLGVIAAASASVSATLSSETTSQHEDSVRNKYSGTEECWIDFSYFARVIRKLAAFFGKRRLWVLIDEWTTIPPDIQPYLADMIRRSMFSVPNITVKIGAIEHRASFKKDLVSGGYIGFELGADIGAAMNLDDYLVIDNDEERAKQFFRTFITNHTVSVASEIGVTIEDPQKLISAAFTQENVFTEFVRSTEGVPRDAMHILCGAAQKASNSLISMQAIRASAYNFFQSEKYSAIQSNKENRVLLEWIRDEVIANRKTRAFLLPVGTVDPVIDRLFDRRALHILNRSRSAAHRPGERFIVYKLDYGLYIDLVNTDKFPSGMLLDPAFGQDVDFEVPLDDARSYRRAILDLSKFYNSHKDLETEVRGTPENAI
jgi:hypothetical protein